MLPQATLNNNPKYVSRGGIKLEHAIKTFNIDAENKICLDIGASTGGFTDCLLKSGGKQLYTVDVGYGQLAYKLRIDPRVVVVERTNARYLKTGQFPVRFDIITIDVSFISLEKILPVAKSLLMETGIIIALVKPNFEVGKGKVGKKGVVREPELHLEVLKRLNEFLNGTGLILNDITYSPLKGPEGNIEFFMKIGNNSQNNKNEINLANIVKKAWEVLSE